MAEGESNMNRSCRATRGSVIASLCLVGALGCQSARGGAPQASAYEPTSKPEPQATASAPVSEAPQLEAVFFDLDRWELRDEARAALKENARQLQESEEWVRLTIEGHCDERGSDEYNMALGGRRAEVVSRYLKDLGVPAARLSTVSFGEDRPAVEGHDESAWRRNRRAELNVTLPQQASR